MHAVTAQQRLPWGMSYLVRAVNLLFALSLRLELPLGHLKAVHDCQQLPDRVCLGLVRQLSLLCYLHMTACACDCQPTRQPEIGGSGSAAEPSHLPHQPPTC